MPREDCATKGPHLSADYAEIGEDDVTSVDLMLINETKN